METRYSAPTIAELLVEHNKTHQQPPRGEILTFCSLLPNCGIYNPTAPFLHDGKLYSAARVDMPGSEEAVTQFFSPNGSPTEWHHDSNMPTLPWQDPFTASIGNVRYFGGIRIYEEPRSGEITDWDTVVRIVQDPTELHEDKPPDIVGPRHMKGIRPLGIDGELAGLFTRPIDDRYPRGKVGFLAVESNVEITADDLANAPIIDGFIAHEAGEWGGVTGAHDLGENKILALMHLARYAVDGASKEYFGGLMLLSRHADRVRVVAQKIVACRQCFPETPFKRPDVKEVVYLTDMSVKSGEVEAWGGLSDYTGGRIAVGDYLS